MFRVGPFPSSSLAVLGLIAGVSGCIEDATRIGTSERAPVVCESLIIESEQDLRAARDCEVVEGDLFIRSDTLERVAKDALPRLRKVSGSLISIGGRPLREISLPALQEVGTELDDVLELGFDSTHLERISLPSLRQVQGSLGIAALGVLTELDLRALERVEQHLGLINLPQLQDLQIPEELGVQGRVGFQLLCQLPATALPGIASDGTESEEQRDIGCCTDDAVRCSELACACE